MSAMKKREFTVTNERIGEVIRSFRKKRQLTGYDFGVMIGLSQQQVSRYERGINHMTLNQLVDILTALELTIEDFVHEFKVQSDPEEKKSISHYNECMSLSSFY